MRPTAWMVTLALTGCTELLDSGTPPDLKELEQRIEALEADRESDAVEMTALEARVVTAESLEIRLAADQDALDDDLAKVEATVVGIQTTQEIDADAIVALGTRIDGAEASQALRDEDLAVMHGSITSLQTAQGGLAETVASIDVSVTGLSAAVATSSSGVVILSDAVDDLIGRADALEFGLGGVIKSTGALGLEMSSTIADVGVIDEIVGGLVVEVDGLTTTVGLAAEQASLDLVVADVSGLQASATSFANDLQEHDLSIGKMTLTNSGQDVFISDLREIQGTHDLLLIELGDLMIGQGNSLATLSGDVQLQGMALASQDTLVTSHTTLIGGLQDAVTVLEQADGVVFDDTYLFAGTAPTIGWNMLDLSPQVGVNPAIVVLEVDIIGDVGSGEYFFRDYGAPFGSLNSNAIGGTQGYIETTGTNFLVVSTDEFGRLEWNTSFLGSEEISVRLVAHVN